MVVVTAQIPSDVHQYHAESDDRVSCMLSETVCATHEVVVDVRASVTSYIHLSPATLGDMAPGILTDTLCTTHAAAVVYTDPIICWKCIADYAKNFTARGYV